MVQRGGIVGAWLLWPPPVAPRLAVGEKLCLVARARKLLDRLLCFPLFALEDHGYQQGWGCVGASSESLGYFDCQVPRQASRDHIWAFAAPRCYLWGKSGGTDVNVINGKELHRKLHRDDGGFHLWGRWRPSFYHWRFDKGLGGGDVVIPVRVLLEEWECGPATARYPCRPAQAVKKAYWDRGFGNWEYGAETNQNNAHRGELHVGAFLVNTAPDRRPHGKLPRPGACRYIIPCTDKLPVCHRYTPVLQAKRRKAAEVVEAGKPNTPQSVYKLPCCTVPRQEDGSEEEALLGPLFGPCFRCFWLSDYPFSIYINLMYVYVLNDK